MIKRESPFGLSLFIIFSIRRVVPQRSGGTEEPIPLGDFPKGVDDALRETGSGAWGSLLEIPPAEDFVLHPDLSFLFVSSEPLFNMPILGVTGAGFAMTVVGWGFPCGDHVLHPDMSFLCVNCEPLVKMTILGV